MTREATRAEQIQIIQRAVETAIKQASEISGLRNWMIYHHFKALKIGEWPNDEAIVQGEGQSLEMAFGDIIDPDDHEYLKSRWFVDCATEKGIFKLADIAYESEPI